MTYKTILAPIMFEKTARPILDACLMLAGRFHGHVHAKHIRQQYEYYPPVAYYPMAVDMPVVASEKVAEAAAAFARTLRSVFDEACDKSGAHIVPLAEALKQNGVTASWSDIHGVLPMDYGRIGRIADLSVTCLPDKKRSVMETTIFESLLMTSGRPVLLIPREGMKAFPKKVLVAWDGSLQAARAVQAAIPFLHEAEEVHVVTIGQIDVGAPSTEAAADYLQRAGIKAEASIVAWPKKPVAERVLNQAEAHNCDLVVMGGYSHARMYESILGGVTHHMVEHADRAVLMAH